MFQLFGKDGLYDFNENINNWNVSNVTTMEEMFTNSEAFNQPIDKWDVSKVTKMEMMFMKSLAFNQSIDKWDVSKVTTMKWMFDGSQAFNQPIEINWMYRMLKTWIICLEIRHSNKNFPMNGKIEQKK